MPDAEAGGELASLGFLGVDVITFRMNAGEERVKPEEGEEGNGAEGWEKPGAKASCGGWIPALFEEIQDGGERDDADLPLEEAEEDGLGDAPGLPRGKGVADIGSEDHRDGDEGDAKANADPEGPEEEG